jgi:IclR family transcriptional regulator, KDG regulon repressor
MKSTSHRKVIASVQNAMNVLDLFNGNFSELGNGEIAKKLNMNPATVAGLVYTLKATKYLDQNPENRKYRLGVKILDRASVLLNQLDLRKISAPYLEELRDWCGESVNLGILDQDTVVYIERLFGHHALGIRTELGKRSPLHSTALGKAILSHLTDQERDTILEGYQFSPITPYTITDKKKFFEDLDTTRNRGYSIDDQENELGGRCIGVAILNHQKYPIAAISISTPIQRFSLDQVPDYSQKLRLTGESISKHMGFRKDHD